MKAIRIHAPGGPEAHHAGRRPRADAEGRRGARQGRRRRAELHRRLFPDRHVQGRAPAHLGLEAGGTVTAVGPNVSEVKVGDKVAYTGVPGAYAEHAAVPCRRLVVLPAGVSTKQGAAAMLQGMTAHYLATSTYPLKKGDTCLVHAAAGGVGLLLCQMAKMRGARVHRHRVHRREGQARPRGGRRRDDHLHAAGLRGRGQADDRRQGRAGRLRRGRQDDVGQEPQLAWRRAG